METIENRLFREAQLEWAAQNKALLKKLELAIAENEKSEAFIKKLCAQIGELNDKIAWHMYRADKAEAKLRDIEGEISPRLRR